MISGNLLRKWRIEFPNVQECDVTKDDSSNTDDCIKKNYLLKKYQKQKVSPT